MGVGGRYHIDEEGEEGAEKGEQAREGEVTPGMADSDLAVCERRESVGEDVDEPGGEDNAGGEALDKELGTVVGRLTLEEAGEDHRRRDPDGAGDEDDSDGDHLEVLRRLAIAAPLGPAPVSGTAPRHGSPPPSRVTSSVAPSTCLKSFPIEWGQRASDGIFPCTPSIATLSRNVAQLNYLWGPRRKSDRSAVVVPF